MARNDRPDPMHPASPERAEPAGSLSLRVLLLVGLGGVLGATGRHLLSELIGHGEGDFPAATFLVNTIGAFALGLLVIIADELPSRRALRLVLGTGVLGAFTTFSTFAIEIVVLVDLGRFVVAATYLVATLLVGIGAAWAGATSARSIVVPRLGTQR